MPASPLPDFKGLVQSLPLNTSPKKQLCNLKCIMRWEREYAYLLGKAREAHDFRAFSSSSSAKPPQHYLSRASQYRSKIDNLYRVYFCDWAPADTAQPPAPYSGPLSSQVAELIIKLTALCPLPLTLDEECQARQDLLHAELYLMEKQAEIIDLDADTQREKSVSLETFLKKYNIWVKRGGLIEDIRRIRRDIVFEKATLSKKEKVSTFSQ